jgi:hypothetical protein
MKAVNQSRIKNRKKELDSFLKENKKVLIKGDLYWWRKDSKGYTDNILEAGIYTAQEAWKTSGHCGPEKRIFYYVVEEKDIKNQIIDKINEINIFKDKELLNMIKNQVDLEFNGVVTKWQT